jgi:hypothetical protein
MVEFFCWFCEEDEYLLERFEVPIIKIKSYEKKDSSFLFHNYNKLLKLTQPKTEILIKVDPDSRINYLPKHLPNKDWFGQVINNRKENIKTVWGCGMGIRIKVIKDFLSNFNTLRTQIKDVYYEKGFSEDLTFGRYLNTLGYFPEHWTEVCLRLKHLDFLEEKRWAITHPHH